jgi:FlaA1/EpsC-like NDP-sugar epimerase
MPNKKSSAAAKRSLEGKRVLILGGTGSLGQRLTWRLLEGDNGVPETITVFSRDEAKQHYMRLEFLHAETATDDVIYRDRRNRLRFEIGDVRNIVELRRAVDRADVIFHAAALKQVPTCEYFGAAAVDTNVYGTINLCQAVSECGSRGKVIVGVSTDKACKPVTVMGMTKALQERLLIQANLDIADAEFMNVRYGNVMASRGSAIPFFIDLARKKKPIPVTDASMTRFLMSLDQSVDLIFTAYRDADRGETYLPVVPSAFVTDVARAVAEDDKYPIEMIGIRPGEKVHEILVSEEELARTEVRGEYLVTLPILPELRRKDFKPGKLPFEGEYSSASKPLDLAGVKKLLRDKQLTLSTAPNTKEIYR